MTAISSFLSLLILLLSTLEGVVISDDLIVCPLSVDTKSSSLGPEFFLFFVLISLSFGLFSESSSLD